MNSQEQTTAVTFEDLRQRDPLYLYAGDVPKDSMYDKYVGLSLNYSDHQHILHDLLNPYPLQSDCVQIYQSEDVFEHIDIEILPVLINEIYRVLKPGGLFRLSVPDYRCDFLYERTEKNAAGELIFDQGGGGHFANGKVQNGGHVWFPVYELVKSLLVISKFKKYNFLHYYDESGLGITKPIDYTLGHVARTPDHDERAANPYRPMSIVVDCYK